MSNFIDFLLVISKLQSPIYCRSPQLEYGGEGGGTEEALGKPLEWRACQRALPFIRLYPRGHNLKHLHQMREMQ